MKCAYEWCTNAVADGRRFCSDDCRLDAHNADARERMARLRRTAEGWAYNIARGRAMAELARRHRDEFLRLVKTHRDMAIAEWERRQGGAT